MINRVSFPSSLAMVEHFVRVLRFVPAGAPA
jgi:hypothetical protein